MPSPRKRKNKNIEVKDYDGTNTYWLMPHKRKMYVSVYAVSRHCGGSEEGGWYYDWYSHVATYPRRVKSIRIPKVRAAMFAKYGELKTSRGRQGRYSVLGGSDIVIVNEDVAGESRSTSTPHYE